jgi:hypothetical protein
MPTPFGVGIFFVNFRGKMVAGLLCLAKKLSEDYVVNGL